MDHLIVKLKKLLQISFDDFCEEYLEFTTILIRNATMEQKCYIKNHKSNDGFTINFINELDIYIYIDDNGLYEDDINESFATIIYSHQYGAKLYHIDDNSKIYNLMEEPVNIQFFNDEINLDEYEIPNDFNNYAINNLSQYINNDMDELAFFVTDAQQELWSYYDFQSYLPFMVFMENLTIAINVNKSSDDYGNIVIFDEDDSVTAFYDLGNYNKFMHVYHNLNFDKILKHDRPWNKMAQKLCSKIESIDDGFDIMVKSATKIS